jgi:peptidoglycan hydrolase-like protein with peptidoglycan-binding domain
LSPRFRVVLALCALAIAVPAAAPAHAATASAAAGGSAYGDRSLSARHLGDRVPLRTGDRGHDVKILQDFFNRIGIRIAKDGRFGSGTYRALRRFEKRAALPVNGVLDGRDLRTLRKVLAEGGFKIRTAQVRVAGSKAVLNSDGTASAPADAPPEVVKIIEAGNEIATKPYRYGGGHGRWNDSGYDCSGSVSYALHGADLLDTPRDSTGLESFGSAGRGEWVSIYANAGHAYMTVAGLRFDTSGRSGSGSRWQSDMRSSSGYVVRHPTGL